MSLQGPGSGWLSHSKARSKRKKLIHGSLLAAPRGGVAVAEPRAARGRNGRRPHRPGAGSRGPPPAASPIPRAALPARALRAGRGGVAARGPGTSSAPLPSPPPRSRPATGDPSPPRARDREGEGRARCTCQSARHFRQLPPLPLGTPRLAEARSSDVSGSGDRRRPGRSAARRARQTAGAAATALGGGLRGERSGEERPAPAPGGRKRRRNLLLVLRTAGRASHPATVRGPRGACAACGAARAGAAAGGGCSLCRGGDGPRPGRGSPLWRWLVGQAGCHVRLQEPSGTGADKGRGNFLVWVAELGVLQGCAEQKLLEPLGGSCQAVRSLPRLLGCRWDLRGALTAGGGSWLFSGVVC